MVRLLVGNLRTGLISTVVPATDVSWSRELDEAGSCSFSTKLTDPDVAALNLREAAAPAASFWAVETDEGMLAGGPIWTHKYNRASGALQVAGAGLLSYYDHRRVMPVLVATHPHDAVFSPTAADLGRLARDLVVLAHSHTGGAVPVVLPPDAAGAVTETWRGFDLANMGQQLRQLTTRQVDAPNIRFTPRRNSADERFVEWVMEVGTAAEPRLVQPGADWYLDATVPRSPVLDVDVDVDGSKIGNRAWVTGEGQAQAMPMVGMDAPAMIAAGYPLLEVDEKRGGLDDNALIGPVQALLTRSSRPVEGWTVTYRGDGNPDPYTGVQTAPYVHQLVEGHWIRLLLEGDPYLPDGEYRCRLARIDGNTTTTVKLTMAPPS